MFGEMVPSSSPTMTSMRASKEAARLPFRASNAAPSAREELRTNWRRLLVIGESSSKRFQTMESVAAVAEQTQRRLHLVKIGFRLSARGPVFRSTLLRRQQGRVHRMNSR